MRQMPGGWFPDPVAEELPGPSPRLRYRTGTEWTEHTYDPVKSTPDGQPLAGWWFRAGAEILDALIVGILSAVGAAMVLGSERVRRDFAALEGGTEPGATPPPPWEAWSAGDVGVGLMGLAVSAVYILGFWHFAQATPGKMALGLKLRRRDVPGPMPWSTMLIRFTAINIGVLAYLDLWLFAVTTVLLVLNYLWPVWDSKNQALHDKLAGTNVVRVRYRAV